jgi:hypothetical protein
VAATFFETVPPRSVLYRLWIPPYNFEFRHNSIPPTRSGYDSTSIDTVLKSNWNAITGFHHLGRWVRGFEQLLPSKMGDSQKALGLPFALLIPFPLTAGMKIKEVSFDCRPEDVCRNRDARDSLIALGMQDARAWPDQGRDLSSHLETGSCPAQTR